MRELRRMKRIGVALYRGPIKIEGRLNMCQVRDPWENCIGLRGPSMARPHVRSASLTFTRMASMAFYDPRAPPGENSLLVRIFRSPARARR